MQLAAAKRDAKNEWTTAEDKLKRLRTEVKRIEKNIEESPVSKTHLVSFLDETKKFFSEKGIEFEENTNPIPISGVFPSKVEIVKALRASSKFFSPEEEAEARRKEILGLRQTAMSTDSTIAIDDGATVTCDSSKEEAVVSDYLHRDGPCVVPLDRSIADISSDCVPHNSRIASRNRVLAGISPDMLSKLNKMFTSPTGIGSKSQDSTSKAKTISANTTPTSMITRETPGKSAKSKYLQRYVDRPKSTDAHKTPKSDNLRPSLSFLEQIRNRGSLFSPPSAQSTETVEIVSPPVITNETSSVSNKINDSQKTDSRTSDRNVILTSTPLSFLDAIKARRIDD